MSNSYQTPFKIEQKQLCEFFYFVGEIVGFESFDNFYAIQIDSDVVKLEQEKLRNEMQNFYASDTYSIGTLRVGCNDAVMVEGFWRRCVVTEMLQDRDVEVFAVDLGLHVIVAREQLKLLKVRFLKPAQATIRCCLADIAPKDVNVDYSKKAIKAFKKMTMNTERSVKIEVIRAPKDDQAPVPVLIYVLGTEKKVIVNAMLAEKFNCVISTGPDSTETIVACDKDELPEKPIVKRPKKIVETQKPWQKRMEVEILHIVDPSEFYVIPKHRIEDIKKLRGSIKHYMTINEDCGSMKVDAKQPINGKLCLAKQADKNGNIERHRAKVISLVSEDFNVLLIDEGFNVIVKASDLFEIPEPALRKPAGAVKVHMAGARPTTGDQWAFSSIDQFKELLRRFESYYVSIVCDKDDGGFPVIVWGITTEEIKIVTQKQFHNLTAYLSYYGFIDCYEKIESEDVVKVERSVTDETFGWKSNKPCDAQAHRVVFEEVTETEVTLAAGPNMSLVPQTIDAWTPSEMNTANKFLGLVTNVDDDGHLSIQTEQQKAVMKEMTDKLTNYYSTLPAESFQLIPKGGQAVIIFKELHAKFYRGRVEALPTRHEDYKITLVDYGTVEYVKKHDIFINVIAANVPIQSQHFRLASVVPSKKNNNEWPKETLKFLDEELVDDEEVSVEVTLAGDVSECLIFVLDKASGKFVNVEQLLISKNLASARQADSSWPPMKTRPAKNFHKFDAMDPKKLLELDEIKKCQRVIEEFSQPRTIDVPISKTRGFLHSIKQDYNDELVRAVMLLRTTQTIKPMTRFHASFNSTHKWECFDYHNMATIPTEYDFEQVFLCKPVVPYRKTRSYLKHKPPANIYFYDLQAAEINEFHCTFVSVLENTKIFVKPTIEELIQKSREMDHFTKNFDSQFLEKFRKYEKAIGELCVVNDDSILKRGRIVLADGVGAFEVFLIDFAEFRLFDNVFKMPMKFRNFPCQVLLLMLKGISVGPKACGGNDIVQHLPKLLKGHLMTAVVRCHDEKDYPQVELLIDEEFALQSLIDGKLCIYKED